MKPDLRWVKLRLDPATRSVLDRAVAGLNRQQGARFRLLRHPSGKCLLCRVDDLWFCRVGEDGPPPRTLTLAIDTRPEPQTFLPGAIGADFEVCCDLLGFQTAAERDQFHAFLQTDPGQAPASS